VSVGTPGVGSIPQMAGILFEKLTGVRLQFEPYRGAAPEMQDLIAADRLIVRQAWNSRRKCRAGHQSAPMRSTAKDAACFRRTFTTSTRPACPGLYAHRWNGLWFPKGSRPEMQSARLNAAASTRSPIRRAHALGDLALRIHAVATSRRRRRSPLSEGRGREVVADHQRRRTSKWNEAGPKEGGSVLETRDVHSGGRPTGPAFGRPDGRLHRNPESRNRARPLGFRGFANKCAPGNDCPQRRRAPFQAITR